MGYRSAEECATPCSYRLDELLHSSDHVRLVCFYLLSILLNRITARENSKAKRGEFSRLIHLGPTDHLAFSRAVRQSERAKLKPSATASEKDTYEAAAHFKSTELGLFSAILVGWLIEFTMGPVFRDLMTCPEKNSRWNGFGQRSVTHRVERSTYCSSRSMFWLIFTHIYVQNLGKIPVSCLQTTVISSPRDEKP